MKSPRPREWLCPAAGVLVAMMVACAATAAETPPPPGSPLNVLVKKFTETRTAQAAPVAASQPVAQPIAQPVAAPAAQSIAQPTATAINRDPAAKKAAARKPSPPLASLPAPTAAAGPLRILLVDDDWSDNNARGGDNRRSGSDDIFRTLVAAAVGGEAAAWSAETVETYKHGPGFERLRDFNVVIWYTGASYGGNPDNTGVLSLEDEKTARRYLQEIGGAFILVSPGYVNNLSYGSTWTDSAHPFLKEVAGINGFAGLVQRFAGGMVLAHDGSSYEVAAKGAAESQFSAVNPDGAAIVFTSKLDPRKTEEKPVPVATAHPFGGGRFVYVGFTFENIPEADRAKAFKILLDAAGAPPSAPAAGPTGPGPGRVAQSVRPIAPGTNQQRIVEPPAAPPGPPPQNLEVTGYWPANHALRWIATGIGLPTGINSFEVFRRDPDGWKYLKGGFRESFYYDPSFVAPNSAYKVVAVYTDGRRGEAVVKYPNPPQPGRPTGLRVVQTAAETVQIDWVNAPGVGTYRVYGPGAPDAGLKISTGTPSDPGYGGRATMDHMPIGIHEIRVAAEYGSNLAPIYAAAKVAVNSERGRYRLVFLGVKVTTPVSDDILDFDGKGNEIYAAAFWATTPQTPSQPAAQGGFARSLVHGDTNNFPARIRAGSAGPTGGLRAGDFVPSPTVQFVQPGVAGESDRFPLRLWEGELVESGPIVAVIPIVFEWNASNHTAWDYWANYWSGGGNILQKLGDAMRANLSAPLAPQPLFGTWTVYDPTKTVFDAHEERPSLPGFTVAADRDRPIGLINTSTPGTVPQYGHKTVGFTLTRRRVEAALAGQSLKLLQLTWSDAASGNYTGYFQLERLSEPPLVAPPPPPVLAVVPVVPMVVGTAIPATPPSTPAVTPTVTQLPAGGRDPGNRTIQPLEAPPAGPPPTQLFVSSESAARHMIRWQGGTGATFNVFRKQGDQWITVVADTTFTQALDASFVAPGTVYQVVARHADGRVGQAEITFAAPAQPLVVRELKFVQTGERKAKLTWKWTSDGGVRGHRVFAPGLPAAGQLVAPQFGGDTSLEIPNAPEGTHAFRVAIQYDEKVAPVDARITATVATWSGQYRLVLLGFRVGRKTVDDDIFDGDGRGDEIFFGAYRAQINVAPGGAATTVPLGFVQSLVLGDTHNFATRVRTGSAGPTGGIRSGDVIPSEAALAAHPGIAAANDRLPLLLWSGGLSNDSGPAVVALTAFEWDNTSTANWNYWKDWWSSPNGSMGIRVAAREALVAAPNEVRYVPLMLTYEVEPAKPLVEDRMALPPPPGAGVPKEIRYLAFLLQGRPIGNRPIGALKSIDPNQWYCVPHGFALSRHAIEKTLGTSSAAVIGASLAMRRGPGANKPDEQDEADYTVYVQIERTSGAPVTAP